MSAKNRKADREERLNARHARSNDRKARTLSRREQRVQAARKRHSYALSRRNAQTRRSRARKELASLDYIQPIEPKRVRRKTSRTTPSNTPSDFTRDTKWMDDGNELAGKASWYGKDFHGGKTASGLRYDMYTFTAAHRTLPLGTVVKVTTLDEGKSVVVCVTDRGPYVRGRVIDLSYAAATQLGLRNKGIGDVNLEIICDKDGKPLKKKQAFFVQYKAQQGNEKAGPFKEFADACAMQEALRQAHPDAAVILDSTR
ncbi:MAG: septal ring lytic transglycosylase RlpA family protein [Desulfovibrionaceae bacterium]|nr:septal ring lytic transglycosylase RlpA family protein [Desulfovibrionaceae bacterium]